MDFVNFSAVPPEYADRLIYYHTPTLPLMRTSVEENTTLGQWVGEKVGRSIGPAVILIPMRGFSDYDQVGRQFWDPAADRAFIDALYKALEGRVPVVEVDLHINDPRFASLAVGHLLNLLQRAKHCAHYEETKGAEL